MCLDTRQYTSDIINIVEIGYINPYLTASYQRKNSLGNGKFQDPHGFKTGVYIDIPFFSTLLFDMLTGHSERTLNTQVHLSGYAGSIDVLELAVVGIEKTFIF